MIMCHVANGMWGCSADERARRNNNERKKKDKRTRNNKRESRIARNESHCLTPQLQSKLFSPRFRMRMMMIAPPSLTMLFRTIQRIWGCTTTYIKYPSLLPTP
eukprot:10347326-Ditylum_brightwellii.AAC.1